MDVPISVLLLKLFCSHFQIRFFLDLNWSQCFKELMPPDMISSIVFSNCSCYFGQILYEFWSNTTSKEKSTKFYIDARNRGPLKVMTEWYQIDRKGSKPSQILSSSNKYLAENFFLKAQYSQAVLNRQYLMVPLGTFWTLYSATSHC